ncbi:unnamed protein product [Hymenolepis diminuta]|uniref:Uncharacterized protein n=1 Tax=Hymenolepis diminuta TaxID=6216 RepID=A0A564YFZ1_HYMDI|nr:unnamed protein product [Hymenolepis diminuta]VUZ45859.1 unnamed protein product [Hymenolepis diminuta]VUZ57414.1 unnamed protein product [Hymenolepis diminuta]
MQRSGHQIKCGSGVNQQEFGDHKYGDRILSETALQNVSTLRKTRNECWLCNDLYFAHDCVAKGTERSGRKAKQDVELVFVIVIERKAVSKVNAVRKMQNGDIPLKPKTNVVFCSRHPRQRL